jgi:integrase
MHSTCRLAGLSRLARDIDPSEAKKEQKRAARFSAKNTFEAVAREWCENQRDGWTGRYHDHVVTRLEADVFPELGSRPIAEIEPPELLAVLRKVEKRGALEIAKRLRQTVGQVFRYGIVTGRAKRDPAVELKGALKASGRQAHHKAMPREDLPEFLRALSNYDGEARTRLALRLAVLTFVRTTELRAVRCDEVDLEAAEWRIPAERMKMRAPHIVPLSRQAVETISTILPKTERLSSIILDAPRSPSSLIFCIGCGLIFRDLDVEVANQARPPFRQVFAQVREQRRPVAIIVAA